MDASNPEEPETKRPDDLLLGLARTRWQWAISLAEPGGVSSSVLVALRNPSRQQLQRGFIPVTFLQSLGPKTVSRPRKVVL